MLIAPFCFFLCTFAAMKKCIVPSAPLFPIAASLIAGIVMGERLGVSASLWPLFVGSVVLALFCHRRALAGSISLMASSALLGMLLTGMKNDEAKGYTFDKTARLLEAVIISEPAEKAKTFAFDVLLTTNGRKLKCFVERDSLSRRLSPGTGLVIYTRIEPFTDFGDGRFDYEDYLLKHGFSGRCYAAHGHWQPSRVSLRGLSPIDRSRISFLRWRHRLLARYRLLGASSDRYAVLAAMTLGDKSALTRELRDAYSVTGASHVLALSGLHLGIIYFLLSLFTLGHRRRLWVQAVLIASVWAFAFLVGLPVSVVRSATMLSIFALFSRRGNSHASVNVLSFAAILILLQNPYALFDVGFQLSFMAVLAILLLLPLTEAWVSAQWTQEHWLAGRLWSCLTVSMAAQVGTAPLVAFYFGRFACYFLLTNLIVLPAAYLVLLGSLAMLLLPFAPVATAVFFVVDTLNHALALIARLPMASIEGLAPTTLQVMLCYVVIALVYAALLRLNNQRLCGG